MAIADYQGPLNEAQLRVLRWVAAGCPAGVFQGYSQRVSAAALRSRGLVKITGRGPTWHAALQPAGQRYLDALDDTGPTAGTEPESASAPKHLESTTSDRLAGPARQLKL